jgi:hypothetical protein
MSTKTQEAEFLTDFSPSTTSETVAEEPTQRFETPLRRTRRVAQVTTTPKPAPPDLVCPECDRPLAYRQTVIGGVKPVERWDYFACRTCGSFVYRSRTRKLRPIAS